MDLIKYAQTQITSGLRDLWRAPFSDVRTALQQVTHCCDTWMKMTEELTGTRWPQTNSENGREWG